MLMVSGLHTFPELVFLQSKHEATWKELNDLKRILAYQTSSYEQRQALVNLPKSSTASQITFHSVTSMSRNKEERVIPSSKISKYVHSSSAASQRSQNSCPNEDILYYSNHQQNLIENHETCQWNNTNKNPADDKPTKYTLQQSIVEKDENLEWKFLLQENNRIQDYVKELHVKQQIDKEELIRSHNQKSSQVHKNYKLTIEKNKSDYMSRISMLEDLVKEKDGIILDLHNALENKVQCLESCLKNTTAELQTTQEELIKQTEKGRNLRLELDNANCLAFDTINKYKLGTEANLKAKYNQALASINRELIAQQKKADEISKAYDILQLQYTNQVSKYKFEQQSLIESHEEQILKITTEYQDSIETANAEAAIEVQNLHRIATQGEQIISHLRESICTMKAENQAQLVALESELQSTKQDLLNQVTYSGTIRSELDTIRNELLDIKRQHSHELEKLLCERDDALKCYHQELQERERKVESAHKVVEYSPEFEVRCSEDSNDESIRKQKLMELDQDQLADKLNDAMQAVTLPPINQNQSIKSSVQGICTDNGVKHSITQEDLEERDELLFGLNNSTPFTSDDNFNQTTMDTASEEYVYHEFHHLDEESSSTPTLNIIERTPKPQEPAIEWSKFHAGQLIELLDSESVRDKTSEDSQYVSVPAHLDDLESREETEITFFRSDSFKEETDVLYDFDIVHQCSGNDCDIVKSNLEQNDMICLSSLPQGTSQLNNVETNLKIDQDYGNNTVLDYPVTGQSDLDELKYDDDLNTLKDIILTYLCLPDGSPEKDTVFRIVASMCGFKSDDYKKIEEARNPGGWWMSQAQIKTEQDISIVSSEGQPDYNRVIIKDALVKYLTLSQNSNEGKRILSILGSLLHFTEDDYGRIACIKKKSTIWW